MVWYGMAQYRMVWYGMVWYGSEFNATVSEGGASVSEELKHIFELNTATFFMKAEMHDTEKEIVRE
jgi:hypothetical protein